MLIASTGSRRESLAKGTLRVLGTLVGAVIGLLLVGMFAQDRHYVHAQRFCGRVLYLLFP